MMTAFAQQIPNNSHSAGGKNQGTAPRQADCGRDWDLMPLIRDAGLDADN